MPEQITIVHFNDVYNVESRESPEPVGGAARFSTAVKSLKDLNPLVLFSGDIFSPSMLSIFTKGEQMIDVLNEIGTHCAVFGNHDFDIGLDTLSEWVSRTNFPWLMSNVVYIETKEQLGGGSITHIIDWNGRKIGLIGLVEKEWIDTLVCIDHEDVIFTDFVEAGRTLGAQLKKEGCDYIIALTHMRNHNDITLAEQCDEIDLILGGHDHVYEIMHVNGKYIIKSGTDFRQFNKITVDFSKITDSRPNVTIQAVDVTRVYEEDPVLNKKLEKFIGIMEGKMDEVLGHIAVPLEGRFSVIRTQETNLGNWICDILLAETGADLVIINSGTFRSDQVHSPGPFTLRDCLNIIPLRGPLVMIKVTGQQIYETLENSVSMYPTLEGRFPQVSGIKFAFDPKKPPGSRVDVNSIKIKGDSIKLSKFYILTTKAYMQIGCDGYVMLKNTEVIENDDCCLDIALAIQNYLRIKDVKQRKIKQSSKQTDALAILLRRHSLGEMLDDNGLKLQNGENEFDESTLLYLAPKVNNRISILGPNI